jgi:ketosteroid isomerase-like protein
MHPSKVVHALFERMQARDWACAREAMAADARICHSAAGEKFSGARHLDRDRSVIMEGHRRVQVVAALPTSGLSAQDIRDRLPSLIPNLDGLIVNADVSTGVVGITISDADNCVMGRRTDPVEVWYPQSADALNPGFGCGALSAAHGEFKDPPHRAPEGPTPRLTPTLDGMTPADVVRALYDRMQARDWASAAACMAPSARIQYTATGEQFTGAGFMAMNEAYPEGWTIEVIDIVATGDRVAAQVRVPNGGQIDWVSGFYTVTDGVIVEGTEHWVTDGLEPAPDWRRPFTING